MCLDADRKRIQREPSSPHRSESSRKSGLCDVHVGLDGSCPRAYGSPTDRSSIADVPFGSRLAVRQSRILCWRVSTLALRHCHRRDSSALAHRSKTDRARFREEARDSPNWNCSDCGPRPDRLCCRPHRRPGKRRRFRLDERRDLRGCGHGCGGEALSRQLAEQLLRRTATHSGNAVRPHGGNHFGCFTVPTRSLPRSEPCESSDGHWPIPVATSWTPAAN